MSSFPLNFAQFCGRQCSRLDLTKEFSLFRLGNLEIHINRYHSPVWYLLRMAEGKKRTKGTRQPGSHHVLSTQQVTAIVCFAMVDYPVFSS